MFVKKVNEKAYSKDGKILVDISKKFYRPSDVELLIGDYSKAKNELGWEPKTTFNKLAEIMVKADIEKNK